MSGAAAIQWQWPEGRSTPVLPDRLLFGVTTNDVTLPLDDPQERRAIAALRGGDEGAYDYLVSKYLKRVGSVEWNIGPTTQGGGVRPGGACAGPYPTRGPSRGGEP